MMVHFWHNSNKTNVNFDNNRERELERAWELVKKSKSNKICENRIEDDDPVFSCSSIGLDLFLLIVVVEWIIRTIRIESRFFSLFYDHVYALPRLHIHRQRLVQQRDSQKIGGKSTSVAGWSKGCGGEKHKLNYNSAKNEQIFIIICEEECCRIFLVNKFNLKKKYFRLMKFNISLLIRVRFNSWTQMQVLLFVVLV